MGTRRGAQRQAESDAFEAANPFLTRVDTRIEVAERDGDHCGPEKFEVLITQDGEEVEGYVNDRRVGPVRTLANEVETPIGEIEASDQFDGPPAAIKVVLSEEGFGVGRLGEAQGGPLTEEHFALDGGESLEFFIGPGGGPVVAFGGEYYPMGGTDFGVDFKVLAGSGTVEIILAQDDDIPLWVGDGSSGLVSGVGTTGSVDADLTGEGDLFDLVRVQVTGDLMVAITGIDVTTNFEGMGFLDPM